MEIAICGGGGIPFRTVRFCPNCQRRRRFSGTIVPYYAPIFTCCACGDAYSEEGRLRRPFARGWRKQASRKAMVDWRRGMPIRKAVNRSLKAWWGA